MIAGIPHTASTAVRAVSEFALLDVLAERLPVAVAKPVDTRSGHGSML